MTFDFDFFTAEDLDRLNEEKCSDGYGTIYVVDDEDKSQYIVDVEYETKEDYDREGISIEVYHLNTEGGHGEWINGSKSIVTATNYKRFVTRAKKEIEKIIKENK